MKSFLLCVAMMVCTNLVSAASDIYVCPNVNGTKTYGNVGDKKGCKKVDLPGLTVFPAPNLKKVAGGKTGATNASGNFPAVDGVTQKNRDAERRQILDDELKAEQKKLADLNAQYNNGQPDRLGNERNYAKYQERTEDMKQDINRTQQNVDALQREIKGLD